jgi:phospholipid/cholesterol/gamma-HCH transport system substrate-binding protein
MERQANYALVGALSVALLLGSLIFIVWLAQFQWNRKFDDYRIIFRGPVSGLSKGGEVQLNGIEVGEITGIHLDPIDSNRVITDIQLEHNTPVRADSTAQAVTQGITGVKYIQITPGSPDRPMLRKVSRERPPVIAARRSKMEDLVADLPQITRNAATALAQVNKLLSDQNVGKISQSLDDVTVFTAQLRNRKQTFEALDTTFSRLQSAASELQKTTAAARIAIGDKDHGALAELTGTLVNFRAALDNAQRLIGRMDGPTQELATTTVPNLNAALVSVQNAADSLDRLTDDIRQDPKATLLRPAGKEVEIKR